MPSDDKETLGYAFMEFATAEEASKCLAHPGVPIDKSHTPKVCLYSEFERLQAYSIDYKAPTMEEPEEQENLHEWLADEEGRDQYVVRSGATAEIFFHDPLRKNRQALSGRTVLKSKIGETKGKVAWSGRGSYLVTYHKETGCIKLWGGRNLSNKHTFPVGVLTAAPVFSPCEKYLITCASKEKTEVRKPIYTHAFCMIVMTSFLLLIFLRG